MSTNHIFATWRMDYVTAPDHKKHKGCIFCDFPNENNENNENKNNNEERFIIHKGTECFVILNIYPYNPGHMMVAPYRHTNQYETLTANEHAEMSWLTSIAIRTLSLAMSPEGFNIGMNLGKIAGAGIAGHLHLHIVPRWNGDNNFMPVISDTRVVPEALNATYHKLKECWQKCLNNA